ncbi:SigB/SigF/SigG family RNA polymerase sigma factor [Romboutsia sedimentorum]|uniref:SigB/SigF/SigG family RNA polymerase sigma factor n=1 Tax=Romboutsia sedimentorum TaxID=1368474 RepID=A0ABT7EC91_9FIRM|nr:SigB/SigF/SigG family RNA polymerase sigma factor [Romboutsia sedimentorum]MDK2564556.1 SigB/SigF/SigG family RNA polymerase sigma factor [Romboutsia sedimentorum]MDK2586668.1 SigB/SigF/SigG family RNA polymerase sigma factor [Romboutsia sedimentorum]
MKNVANATNYLNMDNKELFKIYSNDKNNKEVRNILIEKHLYLVNLLAKKYINKGVEFEDIYQVASLALIYAIDRYDITKGFEFSSFATPTIIGEIKKYFRDKVWTLRVPRRVQELGKKISEAKVFLEQQNKKHPKVKDIANYIGCSEEDVLEAMEASYGYKPISLDSSSNDDSEDKEIKLIDKIGQEENSFANIEQKDFVNKFIECLNELEVKIFKDRFFLDKTQATIAKELEISQMTVSRLEKKIVEKLRKEYEKNI